MKKVNLNKIKKKLMEDPDFEGLEVKAVTPEELEKIKQSEYNNTEDKWYAIKIDYRKVVEDNRDWIIVKEKETDWNGNLLHIEHTIYYDPERVIVTEEITETTRNYRELENKYYRLLKECSDYSLRKEIVKQLLQKRLEFFKKHKKELTVTTENSEYYGVPITVLKIFNKEDGELLYTVDNRFDVREWENEEDKKIDNYYRQIFEFLYQLLN